MTKIIITTILYMGLLGSVKMQDQSGSQTPTNVQATPMQNLFGSDNGGLGDSIRQIPARGIQMMNQLFNGVRNLLPGGLGRNGNRLNNLPVNPSSQQNGAILPIMNPNQLIKPVNDALQQGGLPDINKATEGLGLPNLNLPNLNGVTGPVTDALKQGQLPDINKATAGLGLPNLNLPNLNGVTGPVTDALKQGQLPDINKATAGLGLPNLNLPNLNGVTGPVTDALKQGQLPDINKATEGITNTVSGLTDNLSKILSGQ